MCCLLNNLLVVHNTQKQNTKVVGKIKPTYSTSNMQYFPRIFAKFTQNSLKHLSNFFNSKVNLGLTVYQHKIIDYAIERTLFYVLLLDKLDPYMLLILFEVFSFEKMWTNIVKQLFFLVAMAGLGKDCTRSYGQIGVYRARENDSRNSPKIHQCDIVYRS